MTKPNHKIPLSHSVSWEALSIDLKWNRFIILGAWLTRKKLVTQHSALDFPYCWSLNWAWAFHFEVIWNRKNIHIATANHGRQICGYLNPSQHINYLKWKSHPTQHITRNYQLLACPLVFLVDNMFFSSSTCSCQRLSPAVQSRNWKSSCRVGCPHQCPHYL